MNLIFSLLKSDLSFSLLWTLICLWSFYVGFYRALLDRIRAGINPSPKEGNRSTRLITKLLQAPNQDRPFNVVAAFPSSLQILFGFLLLQKIQVFDHSLINKTCSFAISFIMERLTAGLLPRLLVAKLSVALHLSIGFPFMILIKTACYPISFGLNVIDRMILSKSQDHSKGKEDESEVADHIRILGREGSELEPEIFEIMGNTLEMSHLQVKDVMLPRNQVEILDRKDSLEKNLEIARKCGHTRLPLCDGDLDRCLGIIHVKYAFRLLVKNERIDLPSLAKAPTLLLAEEPLTGALKKMMKCKAHMALVKDEFGGINGVITLENILEEVVGEIQDEFDVDEHTVERLSDEEWKISGLTPVHELPNELGLADQQEELTTFGGLITREIGKIPERGETINIGNFKTKILDADDKRVLLAEVSLKTKGDS